MFDAGASGPHAEGEPNALHRVPLTLGDELTTDVNPLRLD